MDIILTKPSCSCAKMFLFCDNKNKITKGLDNITNRKNLLHVDLDMGIETTQILCVDAAMIYPAIRRTSIELMQ